MADNMPRDILQIVHQSGNVYHFTGNLIRFTEDTGESHWKRPMSDPAVLLKITSRLCYAVGDGEQFVCKPFESIKLVTEAERRVAEARGMRISRAERELLIPEK